MKLTKYIAISKYNLIYFIILADIAILLNIPFLRQILGFILLTILPGLLILDALKLNSLRFTENLVLSVGLSISFLMFLGLLLNIVLLNIHYESPLSTIPLLISINLSAIALIIVSDRSAKNAIFSLLNFNLSRSEKALLIVPILFPVLSIIGAYLMNTTNNNIITIFFLFLVPIYVAFICFFNQNFPSRIYPLVIFLISISLVLMEALRSSHIIGIDTHSEYYIFQTILKNQYWNASIIGDQLDACLSISILPTIYQLFLNANSGDIF